MKKFDYGFGLVLLLFLVIIFAILMRFAYNDLMKNIQNERCYYVDGCEEESKIKGDKVNE